MRKRVDMSGGIIRVKKKKNDYFMALNAPFNDENLSFGARGVLAYLLSKPDDWQVFNEDLYSQSPASRTAVDRMLKELKDNGYLRRFQVPNEKGHRVWVTEIYEDREMNPKWNDSSNGEGGKVDHYPKERFPTVGKPERRKTRQSVDQQSENPNVGKPDDIPITDSNKGLNKQITNKTTASAKPEPLKPITEPYGLYQRLREIQPGINKGQCLKDCKALLNGDHKRGIGQVSPEDIIGCAKFLTTEEWRIRDMVPINTSTIVQKISKWIENGKPETYSDWRAKNATSSRNHKQDQAERNRQINESDQMAIICDFKNNRNIDTRTGAVITQ